MNEHDKSVMVGAQECRRTCVRPGSYEELLAGHYQLEAQVASLENEIRRVCARINRPGRAAFQATCH